MNRPELECHDTTTNMAMKLENETSPDTSKIKEKMKQDYQKALEYAKEQIVDIDKYNLSKSHHKIEFRCCFCGDIKSTEKVNFVHCILNNTQHKKYCSNRCQGKSLMTGKLYKCLECGKDVYRTPGEINKSSNVFCDSSCAAKHNNDVRISHGDFHSSDTKQLISKSLKNRNVDKFNLEIQQGKRDLVSNKPIHTTKCGICHSEIRSIKRKIICSDKCRLIRLKQAGHSGGSKTASLPFHIKNRSKNERLFYDLIREKFQLAIPNPRMFGEYDADIVIPNLKLAIHWNGVWHYKQIFNTKKGKYQFEQIKLRDVQRLNEIQNFGYTNYIVKDMGKYNPEFVREEFDKLINLLARRDLNSK